MIGHLSRLFPARKLAVVPLFLIMLVLNGVSLPALHAEDFRAALCAQKVQEFVKSMDAVLVEKKAHDLGFYEGVIREYLPRRGCNVEEVISISRTSSFFAEAFEQYAVYTIIFKSPAVEFSFGLRKSTGDIEYPYAGWLEQSF